jgi:hypothetical protein
MTSQGPQISNVSQQIMANTNRMNTKIDELATTLEGLSLNKDIKEHINNQLAGIIRQVEEEKRKPNMKVKDLEPYEGEKGKLRSWLTAAHLNMENKGIEGEDAKI